MFGFPENEHTRLYQEARQKYSDRPLAAFFEDGGWNWLTYNQFFEMAGELAKGLFSICLPFKRNSRQYVGLLSNARIEWSMADWACCFGGFVSVPLFPTHSDDQIITIIKETNMVALVVSPPLAERVSSFRHRLPSTFRFVIVMDNSSSDQALVAQHRPWFDFSMKEVCSFGRSTLARPNWDCSHGSRQMQNFRAPSFDDDIATCLYTRSTSSEKILHLAL